MSEAWMKRGFERQQIQEQTHRDVFRLDDGDIWNENRYQACAYLGNLIINYLFGKSTSDVSPMGSYQRIAEDFFLGTILQRYIQFARTKEERGAMLADLAVWLIQMQSLIKFQQALSHKEFMEPQVVFDAPSAMSEV